MLCVDASSVTVGGGPTFGCIAMSAFLEALAARVHPNRLCWDAFCRMHVPSGVPDAMPDMGRHGLTCAVLTQHLQEFLTDDTALMAEVRAGWPRCTRDARSAPP